MRAPQRCSYMIMTRSGTFKGPSFFEIFKSYVRTDSPTLNEQALKKLTIDDIDLKALNFRSHINWQKLNKARRYAELPSVKPDMYE